MNYKASITALMSSFGRAFHAENEEHPVFADHLARALMTDEEYAEVEAYLMASTIEDGFVQEGEAACEDFIPCFDGTGV